jgi:hypothetical protein
MNVENIREVFHAAHDTLIAVMAQLQMPHMPGFEGILACLARYFMLLCGFCLCGQKLRVPCLVTFRDE